MSYPIVSLWKMLVSLVDAHSKGPITHGALENSTHRKSGCHFDVKMDKLIPIFLNNLILILLGYLLSMKLAVTQPSRALF